LAFEALRRDTSVRVVGGDFTLEMMRVGRRRPGGDWIWWAGVDALHLPFEAGVFDAVTSGYLMRNVADVPQALIEQMRVLKPGGRLVCLDTTPPSPSLLRPLIHFHLHIVIPALGRLIAGSSEAYTYLPDSTEGFLTAEQLAGRLADAGFKQVGCRRLMFGTMALHWGRKPGPVAA
jgi:demethylmenaquinone methyltransferase/2-methoxy-6-polyprenyl-1,4-benzoquinol methylase